MRLLLLLAILSSSAALTMPANDARVDWAGRTAANTDGSVSFDWIGVTARVEIQGATFVRVNVTCNVGRGTRLRAYAEDQNFLLYPTVQVWAENDPLFAVKTLWAGSRPSSSFAVTLEVRSMWSRCPHHHLTVHSLLTHSLTHSLARSLAILFFTLVLGRTLSTHSTGRALRA